jgi:hypothetical protein
VNGLQVKEAATQVDIGHHYVATDASGLPIDGDGDGFPDYWEDRDGDNVVDTGETSWLTYNSPNSLSVSPGLTVFTPLR